MEQEKQNLKNKADQNLAMSQINQGQRKVPPKIPPKPISKNPSKSSDITTTKYEPLDKPKLDKLENVAIRTSIDEGKTNKGTGQVEAKSAQVDKVDKSSNVVSMPRNIKKPNETFYTAIRIIGNVLFIPFFVIILCSTILMFSAKTRNEVPSLFGYSAVKILTSSMEDGEGEEFHPNDVVLVKACNPEDLEVGDIIAFYEPIIEIDENNLSEVETIGTKANISTTFLSFFGGGASNEYQRDAARNYSKVIFHRIVDIDSPSNAADEYADKLFFQTQGDRNAEPDSEWVMEDYIVGVYINTNGFVGNLFQFCTTTAGMILLIILPSLIIIAFLALDIYGQSRQLKYEKQFEQGSGEVQEQIFKDTTISKKTESNIKNNKQVKKKEEILKDILDETNPVNDKTEKNENILNKTEKKETTTINKNGETQQIGQTKVEHVKPDNKQNVEPKKPNIKQNIEPKKPDINIKAVPQKPNINKKPESKK